MEVVEVRVVVEVEVVEMEGGGGMGVAEWDRWRGQKRGGSVVRRE